MSTEDEFTQREEDAEQEPPKKRRRSSFSADADEVKRLVDGATRLPEVKRPGDVREWLLSVIDDIGNVYYSGGILSHKERVSIFHAVISYMYLFTGMSENHMMCMSVHEFINATSQYTNGSDNIIVEVEPKIGKYHRNLILLKTYS
jgi:hypothetical protein